MSVRQEVTEACTRENIEVLEVDILECIIEGVTGLLESIWHGKVKGGVQEKVIWQILQSFSSYHAT